MFYPTNDNNGNKCLLASRRYKSVDFKPFFEASTDIIAVILKIFCCSCGIIVTLMSCIILVVILFVPFAVCHEGTTETIT
jgi:hypothetical protein